MIFSSCSNYFDERKRAKLNEEKKTIEKNRAEDFTVSKITAQELQQVLSRMSGAAGAEGWRVSELRALPFVILQALEDMFNVIEETGIWPASLERACVSLIPKGFV